MSSVVASRPGHAIENSSYSWYVCGVLCIAYIICAVDRFLMSVAIVPLKSALALSDMQLGMLVGLGFALLYCTAGVVFGRLSDLVNRRNLLAAGIFSWTLATAACAFSDSFTSLFIARIIVGLGEATLMPAAMSLIASYFSKQRLGRAVGVFSMGAPIGKAIAFMGGGFLIAYFAQQGGVSLASVHFEPWQALFLAAAAPGFLVAAMMFTVREPRLPGSGTRAASARLPIADLRAHVARHRTAYLLHTIAWGCLCVLVNILAAWSPSFFVRKFSMDISHSAFTVGLLSLIFGPMGTVLGGVVMDALNRRCVRGATGMVMAVALALCIPMAMMFTLSADRSIALAGYGLCLICVTAGAGAPGWAGIQMLTPPQHRGMATATIFALVNLASLGAGPTLIGAMSDHVFDDNAQQALGFAIVASFVAFSLIGILVALRSREPIQCTIDEVSTVQTR